MSTKHNLLSIAALVLMAGMLASSCVRFAGDVAGSRCECPILIETAPTIDFIGDGQTPIRVTDGSAPGPRPLQVDPMYNIAYSDETVVEIAERFVDAGYETDSELDLPLRDPVFFTEDQWEVIIGGVRRDGVGRIRIRVRIVEPDRDATEALAPLMDALGTIP